MLRSLATVNLIFLEVETGLMTAKLIDVLNVKCLADSVGILATGDVLACVVEMNHTLFALTN